MPSAGKSLRGKIGVSSRKKRHRRSCFAPQISPLGTVCPNSRTTWGGSTEQRYKKKSNYKRRTPDCVFLCRESAATAPPYNEMGSSSQFVCEVTKSRNNYKTQSQKIFISSKFIRTIRQHFTPTRTKNSSTISQKQRPSQQNSTALFTDTPSNRTSYSSPPSSAPLRAPTRTQRIFVFCLHPSPPAISPSFLAS